MTALRAALIAGFINDICPKYLINTPERLQIFVAQIAHESGEFSIKTESMNYTHAQRIVDIWPTRFNLTGTGGKKNANDYVGNAEKLGNEVYANRMGNGDPASGDGFRFRGGGFLQLTGRESYQKYADYIVQDISDTATKVRTTDDGALDSACWEYAIDKKLIYETDFVLITKRINGGLIGLAERRAYYEKAKMFIV